LSRRADCYQVIKFAERLTELATSRRLSLNIAMWRTDHEMDSGLGLRVGYRIGAAAGCAIGHHEANKPNPNNSNAQAPSGQK
jgi:hypothetical protein